jgi:4'-phosphopantetheinyl transferase
MFEELAPGDLRVWFQLTEALTDLGVTTIESSLSRAECERGRRFVSDHDRRDFIAAHGLLRHTLSLYGGLAPAEWEFTTGHYGKPRLRIHGRNLLAFSLSHTRGLVACAVAVAGDVGVDVEPINESPSRRELAARYFSPNERRYLFASPADAQATRFTELWTLKESYLKARGVGLLHPLDAFELSLDPNRNVRLSDPLQTDTAQWHLVLAEPRPDYRLAAAARWKSDVDCRTTIHEVTGVTPLNPEAAKGRRRRV